MGTAITAPSATMMAEPMIAERMPPPGPPNAGGSWMRKLRLRADAPDLMTSNTTMASTATAINAAAMAMARAMALTISRRRRLPDGVSGAVGAYGSCSDRAGGVIAAREDTRGGVGDDAEHEQDQREIEDGVDLEGVGRVLDVVRDPGRQGVAGIEQRLLDDRARSHYGEHRDRFAQC